MPDGRYKLTKQHARIFENEFLRRCHQLGLMRWRLDFQFGEPIDENNGLTRAYVQTTVMHRLCAVVLNCLWREEPREAKLKRVALHESIHLLTARLAEMARDRNWLVCPDEVNEEVEAIALAIENMVYGRRGA